MGFGPLILHPSEARLIAAKLPGWAAVHRRGCTLLRPRRDKLEDSRRPHGGGIGVDRNVVQTTHASSVHSAEEMPAVRCLNRRVDLVGQQSDRKATPRLKIRSVRMNRRPAAVWSADAAAIHSGYKVA